MVPHIRKLPVRFCFLVKLRQSPRVQGGLRRLGLQVKEWSRIRIRLRETSLQASQNPGLTPQPAIPSYSVVPCAHLGLELYATLQCAAGVRSEAM